MNDKDDALLRLARELELNVDPTKFPILVDEKQRSPFPDLAGPASARGAGRHANKEVIYVDLSSLSKDAFDELVKFVRYMVDRSNPK